MITNPRFAYQSVCIHITQSTMFSLLGTYMESLVKCFNMAHCECVIRGLYPRTTPQLRKVTSRWQTRLEPWVLVTEWCSIHLPSSIYFSFMGTDVSWETRETVNLLLRFAEFDSQGAHQGLLVKW